MEPGGTRTQASSRYAPWEVLKALQSSLSSILTCITLSDPGAAFRSSGCGIEASPRPSFPSENKWGFHSGHHFCMHA